MKHPGIPVLALAILFCVSAGCHRQMPPADGQISADVQAKLHEEAALSGEDIEVAVSNGVVTLSGTATDPASRALAGNDAGTIAGVKTVVNNLAVQPQRAVAAPAPVRTPQRTESSRERRRGQTPSELHQQATTVSPDVTSQPAPPSTVAQNAPAASADAVAAQPAAQSVSAPAPPPQPVQKAVVLEAGTVIPIRIVEALDSATSQPDQSFHATLASDLVSDDMVAAPQGTPVLGRVVDARDAAHFKGNSLLSLELTQIDLQGRHVAVVTDTFSKRGSGRGKDTATKAGGGAVLGSLIGALAGGGKGAAIGAIAGAGAGTGVNAATHGQQVQIASETLINFKLQSPVTVVTSRAVGSAPPADQAPDEPVLHRPTQ